ncbi:predicted protein [Naegleria gruberi]|uniref:Predicted protein n=1 Tax=Naegleria gruberi TaxID=5762 RepID=D2V9W0_NAEGR|nr:uncharacterized protein NAEGRDRAFT_65647 [Naegleria gruberi]EFC46208.1 predicted protein [Naegleria gruberi]|eukprot:XP_002678952.1 predicted protein [Naegleria gruberi strain NEG-M]
MRIVIGFEIGVLRPLLEVPELMGCVFEYLDCSSLITLTMTSKQFFGLHEPIQTATISNTSSEDEKQDENSSSINNNDVSLLLDVNLWRYLLHFYEKSNEKLTKYQYVYNFKESIWGARERSFTKYCKSTWYEVNQSRKEMDLIFKEDLLEKHKIIKEIIEKLKKLYPIFKLASTQMNYIFDIDRNGRAACRYKHCKSHQSLSQNNVRGKTVEIGCTSWDGVYHVECFIELLHDKHVNVGGIQFDCAINTKELRKIFNLSLLPNMSPSNQFKKYIQI